MSELIKGSGGGKSGGDARAPVEAPDSLRSKQYARVLDLISEGEIEGLSDGLKSVYLDGTSVQNIDGSFNFTNVTFETRTGTQAQEYITGLSGVESEIAVSTEVTVGTPVTRTISNPEIDRVRITIGIPQLTSQNTKTGDLNGTSVEFALSLQNNGGGFQPLPIRKILTANGFNLGAISSNTVAATSFQVTLDWTGVLTNYTPIFGFGGLSFNTTRQSANLTLQYRAIGATAWISHSSYEVSGAPVRNPMSGILGGAFVGPSTQPPLPSRQPSTPFSASFGFGSQTNYFWKPPFQSKTVSVSLPLGTYEFQVVITGTGTASISKGLFGTNAFTEIITGKTTTKYQRAYEVALPPGGPWDIRMTRVTPDSTAAVLANKTFFESYTEIISDKLRYPNSALAFLQIDASQFKTIPVRGYLIKGIKVQVPVNYNPLTRVYTGLWNGTFKQAWTDNPAWVFYDLVTKKRYGLGEFVTPENVNKWALYSVAQYCDEMVPDGEFGLEPRFTCNLYLQSQEEAFTVLNNVASIFRAMTYWSDGGITAVQDKPSNPVALFNSANVVNGEFSYTGSSGKTRHTIAKVSWNDPKDLYRQKIEYVEDAVGITRYGIVPTDVTAMGCTSRAQAHRFGKALLFTEQYEGEVINFTAGIDHIRMARPGSIIKVQDRDRAGKPFGGRILSATLTQITVDRPILIEVGKTYTFDCVLADGTIASRTLTNAASTTSVFNLSSALPSVPLSMAMWVLSANDLLTTLWRVVSIAENTPTEYSISALAYRADKYAAIENNVKLSPLPESAITTAPKAVSGVSFIETLAIVGVGILGVKGHLSWIDPSIANRYEINYRIVGGNYSRLECEEPNIEIVPMQEGNYEFVITAINALGRRSPVTQFATTVLGKKAPPANIEGLTATIVAESIYLNWNNVEDLDFLRYEVRFGNVGVSWTAATHLGFSTNNAFTYKPTGKETKDYLIKAIDTSANSSVTEARISFQPGLPLAPSGLTSSFDLTSATSSNVIIKWGDGSGTFGLSYYDVSLTLPDGTARSFKAYTTEWVTTANWVGNATASVKTVDTLGTASLAATLIITKFAPNPPATYSAIPSLGALTFKWSSAVRTTLPIVGYEIRNNNSGWGDSAFLFKGTASEWKTSALVLGLNDFYIKSIDTDGIYSTTALSMEYTISAPANITSIVEKFNDTSLTTATVDLDWDDANPIFGLAGYEVTYGAVNRKVSSSFVTLPADWVGNRTFTIKVLDTLGNLSSGLSKAVQKFAPNPVTNVRAQVIDNNVLLYWTPPVQTSLPVNNVQISRGATFATSIVVGNKSGSFTSLFETQAGTITYWLVAVDTEGVKSSPASVTATVSQPPDYVLNGFQASSFTAGTLLNARVENNTIVMPVNLTETWEGHFIAKSWTTPQNQIDAGFPIYAQPTVTSGSYKETFDFGTVLPSSKVTVAYGGTVVAGSPVVKTDIEISNNGVAYTSYMGVSEVYALDFRFVRVTISVDQGSDTHALYTLNDLNVRLDSKLKNDAGSTNALSTDALGTLANFNTEFVDVISIGASAAGTSLVTANYDFKDALIEGTYSASAGVATLAITGHGLVVGQKVKLNFITGAGISGIYAVATVVNANSYTVAMVGSTSGNVGTYPQGMRLYAFNSSGARVSASVSWSINGY